MPLTGSVIATTNLSHDAFSDGYTLSFVRVVPRLVVCTAGRTSMLRSREGTCSSHRPTSSTHFLQRRLILGTVSFRNRSQARRSVYNRSSQDWGDLVPAKSEKSTRRSSSPCLLSVRDMTTPFSTMGCRRIEKTKSTMNGDVLHFATRLCQCVAHDVGHVAEVEWALHPRRDQIWVYPCLHRDTRRAV